MTKKLALLCWWTCKEILLTFQNKILQDKSNLDPQNLTRDTTRKESCGPVYTLRNIDVKFLNTTVANRTQQYIRWAICRNKWALSQECKVSSTFENQPM